MIRVGKIAATHGLQGDVIFSHFLEKKNWLKKEDVLFLELNKDSYIPFFITQVKTVQHDEYIIRLEDVNSVEQAKKLTGKNVYIKDAILQTQQSSSPLAWIGFTIVDKALGEIGVVNDIFQTGHQWLASVHYHDKEVLIPLIEEMIIDLNIRNKFIRMDLPEGLLDV